jgi:hypothetical protein
MHRWLVALAVLVPSLQGALAPTFHKDVLPILQRHCQTCHRPGEVAPMAFLTYEQVRPWAAAIREAVTLKKMPPWGADPAHGKFSNDPSLTAAEKETLAAWAAAKAPEGDPQDAPPPAPFLDGWNIRTPDLVVEMPQVYAVPATGTIDYTYFVVPTGFTADRWVQAAEVRPGNRAVVHHVIVYVREPGNPWLKEAPVGMAYVPPARRGSGGNGEYLAGFTPGKPAMQLAAGQAKLIRAGSDLVFQMHYTPNGKAGPDQTKVGLIFAKEAPRERVLTVAALNTSFAIPPGAGDYPVNAKLVFSDEAHLVTLWPHMHLRGKSFRFELVNPAGERQTLLSVPKYDFNWQMRYLPEEPLKLGPGSTIECFAKFDNSPNNKFNPDAAKEVRWGDQSWEEMMVGFMEISFDARKAPSDILKRPAGSRAAAE